jgi:chemotaxis protein histidine kinase CheA
MQTMIKEAQDGYHFGQDKMPVFPGELAPPGHPDRIDPGAIPEKEECMDCNFTGQKPLKADKSDKNDYIGHSTSTKEQLYNSGHGPLHDSDIELIEGEPKGTPSFNDSHYQGDLVDHEEALEDLEKLIEDLGAEEEISSDLSTEKDVEEKVASYRSRLLALAKKDLEEKICKKCEKKVSKCKCKEIAEKEKEQKEKEVLKAKEQKEKEAEKAKAQKEKEAQKKKKEKEMQKKKASLYEAIFPKKS